MTSQVSGEEERSPFPDPRGQEQRNTLYADIARLLDGGELAAPKPVLLHRTDGHCLFYADQVNYLFGDPESGKTWVALAAVAEALAAGRRVLVLDLDHNGAASTIARLIALGVPEATLRDLSRFRYAEPEDSEHLDKIVVNALAWRPAVVIVDSVGELLPLLGLSSNSPDDFTAAHGRVLKPLARSGAAVIAVDHLAKNPESRSQGASGTAAKRRAIGGASLRVTVKEPFAPGKGGSCYLNIHKDRHGALRAHCPTDNREPAAGIFRLVHVADDELLWDVYASTATHAPEPGVAPEDLTALAALAPPPESVRDVKNRMSWGTERAVATLRAWRSYVPEAFPRNGEQSQTVSVPLFPTQGVQERGTEAEASTDANDLYRCPRCGTPTTPSSQGHASLCARCTDAELNGRTTP